MDTNKMNEHSLFFVLGSTMGTYHELESMDITPGFVVTFREINTGILTMARPVKRFRE